MLDEMDSSLETFGYIFFFRKNEENKGSPYPLYAGQTTIGGSEDADVRLKLNNDRLNAIHCILEVEENGKATVINKSESHPVTVNNISVKKSKVLKNNDLLEILGKKFRYFSEKQTDMNDLKQFKLSNIKTINRYSISHPVHMKSPKVKTKTSLLIQKKPIRRKSTESSGAEFMEKKTPTRLMMNKASTTEKSKTTSKIIGSKLLNSNIPTKIRRLSLGNPSFKKQTPKISSRNITLKSNIITSTIKESNKLETKNNIQSSNSNMTPKKLQIKCLTPKKDAPIIKSSFKNSTRRSLKLEPKAVSELKREASLNLINFSPPRKSIMKTSFRRSSVKLDPEEVSKVVTFQASDEKGSKKRVSLSVETRKTIYSDETEHLLLSSNDSFASPLECSTESDNLFDNEISTKSDNELADRKSKSILGIDESIVKVSESVSPSKILRSSRRMSKDNPKYYSENLVTTPRNKSLQAGTPKSKYKSSLTTSTPMVIKDVSIKDNSSRPSLKKSLNMSGDTHVESYAKVTEMNGITNLTPEDQQGRSSKSLEDDMLARISPIKSTIRKSASKRLSRSVLEKTFSQLSNAEEEPSRSHTNVNDATKAKISKADISVTRSNSTRKSGRSLMKNNLITESSEEPESNERGSFLSYSRNGTNIRKSTSTSDTSKKVNKTVSVGENLFFDENYHPSDDIKSSPKRSLNSSGLKESLELSGTHEGNHGEVSQSPGKKLNTSGTRQSVRLSGSQLRNDMNIDKSWNANSSKLDNKKLSITSKNGLNISNSEPRRSSSFTEDLSCLDSSNISKSSSKMRGSRIEELQSEILPLSYVKSPSPYIENISNQRRSRSSIKTMNSLDLVNENDHKGNSGSNSEILIEISNSGSVQLSESLRSLRKSERSQSLVESNSKVSETVITEQSFEGNFSFKNDKNEMLNKSSLSRKSRMESKITSEDTQNTIDANISVNTERKSGRISRHILEKSSLKFKKLISTSSEKIFFEDNKSRITILKTERSKSLDKGINQINSPILKTSLRRRTGKSLGFNYLKNVSTTDSNNTFPIRDRGAKLSVTKHLESVQNSSYKESFGDSFVSSKTSTPRRSNRSTRKSQIEVSKYLHKNTSAHSAIINADEIIILDSTVNDDSIKENKHELLATPTPTKYCRSETENSTISLRNNSSRRSKSSLQVSISNDSINSSDLATSNDSIDMSIKTPTPRISNVTLVMTAKSPKPRKSARLQSVESPYTPTCTPKNNVSVVDIDTPFEKSVMSPKLSKTLNSLRADDPELTTPKTALKGNRAKSLPYKPITEDISPASPVKNIRDESGFKTPFNTPGLFENIRHSVIKSRSRILRTNSTLEDSPREDSSETMAYKRPRESTGESARLNKRRKIGRNMEESDLTGGTSFSSFHSDDVIPELSKLDATATPPAHFENLTTKPFVVEPETKRQKRNQKNKLHTSPKNDLSDVAGLKRLLKTPRERKSPKNDLTNVPGFKKIFSDEVQMKSPKNDLTNIAGVKKLFSTPKVAKSPKNDLRSIAGVKKLMTTPKGMKSPKNDLTNVAGVKKLMSTPKELKSPRNDLTNVAGVKKLMSTPKEFKSPKNDLTNVAGVKKLMSTPRQLKSPKNDLTNVAGLRKLMSTPKKINSPRNDLSDVTGVRKLMSTPKEIRSPNNDLTKIPSIRNLMSTPKVINSPKNDLSNIEGLVNLFAEHRNSNISDQENNEDLFAKLFDKKPLKTYRGKSMSPYKIEDLQSSGRKTLGDVPITSPRVENWVQEQVKLKQEQLANAIASSKKHRKLKPIEKEILNINNDNAPVEMESDILHSKEVKVTSKTRKGRKNVKEPLLVSELSEIKSVDNEKMLHYNDQIKDTSISKQKDILSDQMEKLDTPVKRRGRRKKVDVSPVKRQSPTDSSIIKQIDILSTQTKTLDTAVKGRGRKKNVDSSEATKVEQVEIKRGRPTRKGNKETSENTEQNNQKNVEAQNDKKEKIKHELKETEYESQQEIKVVRRGRTRMIAESAEQNEAPSNTPQKMTRGKKKGNVPVVESDVQNDDEIIKVANETTSSTIQKKTRGKKLLEDSSNKVIIETDSAKVEVNTRRGRRNIKDNNENENIIDKQTGEPDSKRGTGRRKNNEIVHVDKTSTDSKIEDSGNTRKGTKKHDQEMKATPGIESDETSERSIELVLKPRGRARKKVEIIEEESSKSTVKTMDKSTRKGGKKDEVTSVTTKRTRKVQIEDLPSELTETVSSPLQVPKITRNRRKAKSEEDPSEIVIKEAKKKNKTVAFAVPIVDSPVKAKRRNAKIDLDPTEEPVEVKTKRTRKGKIDVEDSEGKETGEVPPAKRTRREVAKDDAGMTSSVKTVTVQKRTRRK